MSAMRGSTQDQHLDLQEEALWQAGCQRILVDRVSGTVSERPGLGQLKEICELRTRWWSGGSTIGRSLKDLIAWVTWLEQEGVGLRSLHEALDTTTPSGKLTFHIFGALAEFERQLIQERTQAGLRVARARGRLGGRPKALPADKQRWAVQLYQEKKIAVKHICDLMGSPNRPSMRMSVRPRRLARAGDTQRATNRAIQSANLQPGMKGNEREGFRCSGAPYPDWGKVGNSTILVQRVLDILDGCVRKSFPDLSDQSVLNFLMQCRADLAQGLGVGDEDKGRKVSAEGTAIELVCELFCERGLISLLRRGLCWALPGGAVIAKIRGGHLGFSG